MDRLDNMGNWIEQIKTLSLEQIPVTEPERQYYFMDIPHKSDNVLFHSSNDANVLYEHSS